MKQIKIFDGSKYSNPEYLQNAVNDFLTQLNTPAISSIKTEMCNHSNGCITIMVSYQLD